MTRLILGLAATGGLLAGCMIDAHNHAPVVQPASVTAREDLREDLTILAEDEDGDDLTLSMFGAWGGHYVIQKLEYATVEGRTQLEASLLVWGFPDFHGEGEFEVWVSDGVERTSATVTVTIEPVNDKPAARADAFATAADTELVIDAATLLANDDDAADVDDDAAPNHGLSITSVSPSPHGTVAYAGGEIRFTPSPGFAGTAPFTYKISDGEDGAETTVRVLVGGNNAAPAVAEDQQMTMEGVPLAIDAGTLLANDRDDDGHTLAVIAVGNATHGRVELEDHRITFTPMGENGGTFFGTAGFDYIATDGTATSTGHVVVEVAPWL